MNARIVVRINAVAVLALGMSLLVPLSLALLYGDASEPSFLVPALIMAFAGGVGRLPTQSSSSRSVEYVSNRDVYLLVTPEVSTATGESSYYKWGELY
jgi:Trk-type K+ transport system membrane component